MTEFPYPVVAAAHAVLRSLDTRLTAEEREAAQEAMKRQSDFSLGMLTSILEDYHKRADAVAGLPTGATLDRLRVRLLGDSEDDILGVALNDAAPGERVRVLLPMPGGPLPAAVRPAPASTAPAPHEGAPADLEGSTGLSGRHPADDQLRAEGADLAERIEATRRRFEDEEPEAVAMLGGSAQLAALGDRLKAARQGEVAAAELEPSDPWLESGYTDCGHPTSRGPCGLRAGHPAGPGLPGEAGHIGGEF